MWDIRTRAGCTSHWNGAYAGLCMNNTKPGKYGKGRQGQGQKPQNRTFLRTRADGTDGVLAPRCVPVQREFSERPCSTVPAWGSGHIERIPSSRDERSADLAMTGRMRRDLGAQPLDPHVKDRPVSSLSLHGYSRRSYATIGCMRRFPPTEGLCWRHKESGPQIRDFPTRTDRTLPRDPCGVDGNFHGQFPQETLKVNPRTLTDIVVRSGKSLIEGHVGRLFASVRPSKDIHVENPGSIVPHDRLPCIIMPHFSFDRKLDNMPSKDHVEVPFPA